MLNRTRACVQGCTFMLHTFITVTSVNVFNIKKKRIKTYYYFEPMTRNTRVPAGGRWQAQRGAEESLVKGLSGGWAGCKETTLAYPEVWSEDCSWGGGRPTGLRGENQHCPERGPAGREPVATAFLSGLLAVLGEGQSQCPRARQTCPRAGPRAPQTRGGQWIQERSVKAPE